MHSSHRCVMITGDHALTACHVAKQVHIIERSVLILEGDLHWYTDQGEKKFEFDYTKVSQLVSNYDLCVTGPAYTQLEHKPWLSSILPYIYVWARVSPGEKETILKGLKQEGFMTLMCGDGTNDVGALKQAHVGVALLDTTPEELSKISMYQQYKSFSGIYTKQCEIAARFGGAPPAKPAILTQLETSSSFYFSFNCWCNG
ncbi:hypothetical protein HMI55_005474 [Coelomomyces lativittatus]|nr:hypothetical protein HMI55_005474 [Coelomomyces lativittatus]